MPNPLFPGPPVGPGRFTRGPILAIETSPEIYSVTPNFDRAAGGASVTIVGARFATSGTGVKPTVTFGGTLATAVVVVDAQTLTCTAPAHVTGLVDIVVTNPNGQAATLALAFTYVASIVLSITPNYGPIAGGTTVLITGANFPAAPAVTFGGVAAASVVRIDSQHVVAVTAAHAVGVVDVVVDTVTVRGGFFYTLLTRGEDLRRSPSLHINESINGVSQCNFTVDGTSSPPVEGSEFSFEDDSSHVLFAGVVQTVEQVWEGLKNQLAWNVTCSDYTPWLNRRRPFGEYVNVSATDVIKDLIAKFAPWVSVNHVQEGLSAVTISFDGTDDFSTCLTSICRLIGRGYWRLDYEKDLHAFLVDLTASTNGTPTEPITSLGGGDINPTACVLTQGSVAGNYPPGYYGIFWSFEYDNGAESTLGPMSDLVLMDGVHLPHMASIPTGAAIGGHNVTARRGYFKFFGFTAGTPLASFARIADNVTTVLDSGPQAGLTFQAPRIPVVAPPVAPARAPSADQTTHSAKSIIAAIFPSIFASRVSHTYPAGTYAFKLTANYEDGTESLASEASGRIELDGFHGVRFSTNNHADDVNGVSAMFWKVYASRAVKRGDIPSFDANTTTVWTVIPNNTNATYEIVPSIKTENLSIAATSTQQPPEPPTFDLGPSLEDVPSDINDANMDLQREPQIASIRDITQVRNRVIVYGQSEIVPAPIVVPPPDGTGIGANTNVEVTFTGTVDPYALCIAGIHFQWFSSATAYEYLRQHPTFKPLWSGFPMNQRWYQIYLDYGLLGVTPDSEGARWPSDGIDHFGAYMADQGLTQEYLTAHPFTALMDLSEDYYENGGAAGVTPTSTQTVTSTDLTEDRGIPSEPQVTRIRYQADDLDSQRYFGSIELDDNGHPTDGVHEMVLQTNLKTAAECMALARAQLSQFAWPLIQVRYSTREETHPGQIVHIDLSNPPIKGDFLVLSVDVDQVKDEVETTDVLSPRYNVVAADPAKFNLDDLLLLIGDAADITNAFNLSGAASGTNPRDLAASALQAKLITDSAVAEAVAGISSDFLTIAVTISDAQIKALLTTPVTIIPAPGAGKIIDVIGFCGFLNRQAAYTNNPGGSLRYAGNASDITSNLTFLQTSAVPGTRFTRFPLNASAVITDPGIDVIATNKAVQFRAGQDNTAGDPANFFTVYVTYRIISSVP